MLILVVLMTSLGGAGLRPVFAQTATISVTLDPSQSIGVSRFAAGISHMDTSLRWGDANSVQTGRTVVAQSTNLQNTHIVAWGTNNPWPDPKAANPTYWSGLDHRISMARDAGAVPMITFAQAPWWMKGQLMPDGSTRLIPDARGEFDPYTYSNGMTDYRGIKYPAGYVSPSPFATRILDSQMSKWLLMVQRTAERYMAPPYNVRYFQIWNEMKGYWNPLANKWDYEVQAGNTTGYQARHGYTYMYNQAYQRIKQVARNQGIAESEIKIGGPYVFFKTWTAKTAGGAPATEPMLQNKPYGTFDQRDVDVIKYWLKNKVGAEFISWDGGTKNREGTNLVDPFTASEKFRDQIAWLRSLDPAVYPGANTLPVSQSEWYAFPYNTADPQQHNAVKTFAAMHFIRAGGWVTMLWGGKQLPGDPDIDPSLYTRTDIAGGGKALAWASSYQALKTHFGAGTTLIKVTQSSNEIGVLASPLKTMLVNKTGQTVTVSVNGTGVTLSPYQVQVIDTPVKTVGPTPVPTQNSTPVPTQNPTPVPTQNPGSTDVVADYFQRKVVNGWGSAGQGGAYEGTDSVAVGVNGNNGYMTVPNAGAQLHATLGSTSFLGLDMRVKFRTDKPATGAPHEIYLLARVLSDIGNYRARLALTPEGTITVGGQKWVASSNTTANVGQPEIVPGLTHRGGNNYWARVQVTGTNPTTIRIKVWADGQAEPANWHYTGTDSQAVLQAAGQVGILSRLPQGSTAAPIAFAYDDFTVGPP